MGMANLRRKVENLGQRFYCPIHPDESLLCSECDVMELTDAEWDELAVLLEGAGFLIREPFESRGTCWRCEEGSLACLECISERGEPQGFALMSEAAVDRLHELAAKLVPPWLA
jgi:hypothetical protein